MVPAAAPVEIHLRVGPYSSNSLIVYFEPTGMNHNLVEGDWLDVTIRGASLGLIEIGHTPEAVTVGAWPDAEVIVRARDGTHLEI